MSWSNSYHVSAKFSMMDVIYRIQGDDPVGALAKILPVSIVHPHDFLITINKLIVNHVPAKYVISFLRMYPMAPVHGWEVQLQCQNINNAYYQLQQQPAYIDKVIDAISYNQEFSLQLSEVWKIPFSSQWREHCRQQLTNPCYPPSNLFKIALHLGSGIHVQFSKTVMAVPTEGMVSKLDNQIQQSGSSNQTSQDGVPNMLQAITDNTGSPFYSIMMSIMSDELQLVEELGS